MNRRNFVKNMTYATAGASLFATLPLEAIAHQRKTISPNEKINLGVIGCNGMGWANLRSHLMMDDVTCIALCDVDQRVLDQKSAAVDKVQGKRPALYKDFRKFLENKDLDAVIVATPDHWHCLAAINAMQAGKHVYCEKPLANSIEECNLMVQAAQYYDKIVQVGQWQRSGSHYEKAIDYVRSGKLGNIRLVKVWAYQGWMKPVPIKPDESVPEGVDYEMWLGPAPKRPFNPNRFHFNFRWFWDYAGGLMTDWGVHEIDIALYAMQATAPKSVVASGGKLAYPDDASETPDTLQAIFEYDNFNMLWEHATGIDGGNYEKTEGIAFIGNNATLVVNRGGWMLLPETEMKDGIRQYKLEDIPNQGTQGDALNAHTQNFIQAIKNNDKSLLKCGIESGSIAAINAQMGNIAYKTGRKIYWDKNVQNFGNDADANALIHAKYQNGWQLPRF